MGGERVSCKTGWLAGMLPLFTPDGVTHALLLYT
jgi:hypothetical protein